MRDTYSETSHPRILIVGTDWMGDVVFSTPLLRALKKHDPQSYVAYSTTSRCREVLISNPYVDQIVSYDEKTFLGGFANHKRFVDQIRSSRFDIVLFLHRSATRGFLTLLGGIPLRVGYITDKRKWMLTHPVRMPSLDTHRIDFYLGLLKPLNISPHGREVELAVSQQGKNEWRVLKSQTILKEGRKYVVLHPGGNWDLKRWPVEYYAQIIRHLGSKGICSVVCGTERERDLSEYLLRSSGLNPVISFCGKTSVASLMALISESSLLISNDSGPLHLAAGLQVPHVGLFGPTTTETTGPVSKGKQRLLQNKIGCVLPCFFESCHHRICMENLRPLEVIKEIDEFIEQELCGEFLHEAH